MVNDIMQAFADGNDRVLVDSPPGAGKTYLIEETCAVSFNERRWRVAVGTNTKNQRNDFAKRFHRRFPKIPLQVALAHKELTPLDLSAAGIDTIDSFTDLHNGPGVVVSTVHKYLYAANYVPAGTKGLRDLVVADEAYQIQYRNGGLPLDALAPRRLMVGDPGQIEPFTELDAEVFESARDHILWSLPDEILANGSLVHRLAIRVSRRLPPDTVRILQPALYPNLPFSATSSDAERRLAFTTAGGQQDAIDRALDLVANGASLVAIQMPDLKTELQNDPELAELAVALAERIRLRRAYWPHDHNRQININTDLLYMDSHVNSVSDAQEKFAARSIGLRADTPNVIQGQETDIAIVKHPLSSLQDADPFHFDPGRLCVMLSRHKLACIILVRGDVSMVLDRYDHDAGEYLLGREDTTWRGYSAHKQIWNALVNEKRVLQYA